MAPTDTDDSCTEPSGHARASEHLSADDRFASPPLDVMTSGFDQIVVPAESSQVSVARRFVRRALAEAVPPEVGADLQLIVSELVSNEIEHGDRGDVHVTVRWNATSVEVSVSTEATLDEVGPVDAWSVADADQVSGRGLGMVRQLADTVVITDVIDDASDDAGGGRRFVASIDLMTRD